MRRILFLFSWLVFFSLSGNANPTSTFLEGNQFYQKGDFAKAIKIYESILETGDFSGELYFNLANAYLKNNQTGKAILNYERAKKYDSDESFHTNLKIAEAERVDQIEPLPSFFLKRIWTDFRDLFSSTVWSVLTLFFLWIGLGLLAHKALTNKDLLPKRALKITVGFSLVAFLICLIMAFAKYSFESTHQSAIILQKETELKEAPDKISPEIIPLHEGTKVEIIDQIESWYKVRLADGEIGWMDASHLEVI